MRRFGVLVAVVAAVASTGLAGCSSRALGPGEARLTVASGRAEVAATGENWRPAHSDQRLHRNDRVRVVSGLSEVHFSSERTVELRNGSELQVSPEPALLRGDALATAKGTPLTLTAGNADARLHDGAAHVSRGLGITGASYIGDLMVTSAGRDLLVPALRQAGVPGPGLLPAAPTPLDYRADNPWDRRYLGDAIDLGDELEARSQGFAAQLSPDEGHTVGFYRQLLPALENQPSFTQTLLQPDMSPGDTLVGAAIAVEAKNGDFLDRWRSVFAFHADGARWGLVALDQHVSRAPLLSAVDDALGRRTVGGTSAAAPAPNGAPPNLLGPSPSVPPPSDASGGGTGGTGGGTGGGGRGNGGGQPSPPTTTAPAVPGLPPLLSPPPPSPTTTTPPANPVGGLVQGVGNVVGGLLGGLLGGGR